jgi:hypothetical protein
VNVRSTQPASTVAVDGLTVQSILTSARYQPEQLVGAGVHSKVTTGSAAAFAGASNSARQIPTRVTASRKGRGGVCRSPC